VGEGDEFSRTGPSGILGSPRLFQYRRSLDGRPIWLKIFLVGPVLDFSSASCILALDLPHFLPPSVDTNIRAQTRPLPGGKGSRVRGRGEENILCSISYVGNDKRLL